MEARKVTCDGCEKDLTYTGNCEDWRLVLANQAIPQPPGDGFVTLMAAYPPVDRTHHFCDLACLKAWLAAGCR